VLRYVAVLDGEWVALVGFGSAALSCAARDRFLGWSREAQYARLRHVVHNQRFCVLPAGGRPNLASAVLARVLRRLAGDYLAVYGHRVLAVETFTDPARHTGACYAAANFVLLGETLGYARSAGRSDHHGRRQRVWVYLLHRDAPAILAAAYPHPLLAPSGGVDVHTVALAGDSGLLGLLEGLTDPRKKRGIRTGSRPSARWSRPRRWPAPPASGRSRTTSATCRPRRSERLGARRHPRTRAVRGAERADDPAHRDLRRRGRGGRLGRALAGRAGPRRAARGQGVPTCTALALDGKTLKGSWAVDRPGPR
jgi:hypothetical protein